MSDRSLIEWTEATWNPVTGCTKVSPGCAHCYAETFAERFRGVAGHPYERGFDLQLRPERLEQPLAWKQPRLIFVNSMSDLFHEDVPDDYVRQVFTVMEQASWHTFQVLTKRHERLADFGRRLKWPPNVWMGVSVENQRWTCRIDALRSVDPHCRFLSCEPLLGPLELDLRGIGWVIVGGESGHRARRMKPEWAREIRRQCEEQRVPFFFKQWGAYSEAGVRVGKGKAGRLFDGKVWDDLPRRRTRMVAGKLVHRGALAV
jgi:protein gp37